MITRHWYPRDSVGEALFQAAGAWRDPLRKQKVLFWAYELVLSEEWDYLWGILDRMALRWGDSACLTAPKTHTSEAILHFLHLLLSLPIVIPYEPPSMEPLASLATLEAIPEKPVTWSAEQRGRLWIAVQSALRHRQPARLLKLLSALPPSVAAEYLALKAANIGKRGRDRRIEYSPTSMSPSRDSEIVSTDTITLSLKMGLYPMLEMVGCPVLRQELHLAWPELPVGRLQARRFSLPKPLLANLAPGPLDPLVATKEGCAFWRRLWATVKTADDEEAFWNTYFSEDVPDEWSAAELGKSYILS